MGSRLLTTTDRSGLSLAQVGGSDVYKMRPQVMSVLEMGNLGNEYTRLFAEPVDNGRSIDWYVDDGNNVISVDKLSPEEAEKVLARFEEMHNFLKDYAQQLRKDNNPVVRNYADILEKALTVPGMESLYSVDGEPVIANWGFSSGDNDTVEDSRKLIRAIQKKRKEAREEILKAREAANAAELAAKNAVREEPPAPEKPQPAPQPKSSGSGLMLAVIIGALAVLAGLAAAWYFFWNKPEEKQPEPAATAAPAAPEKPEPAAPEKAAPDFSWLKGEHTAKNVLVNDHGEAVDLTFSFDTNDGKGKATVTESGQTCEGAVSSSEMADGKIEFAVSELVCPNKDNYKPLTMICGRGAKSCAGIGPNGEKWELNVNIIGDAQ